MKRYWCLLCLLVLIAAPAFAADQSVTTAITDVVVFTDRAQVTRTGTATVDPGVVRLLLPVEAFAVDPDAVTATVRGKGDILAVQYREVPLREAAQEKIRALENKIRALQQIRRAKVDEKTALARQEAFLESVVDFSKGQIPKDMQTHMPGTEALGRTLDFVDKGFTAVYGKKRAADQAITELDGDIRQLERELQGLKHPGQNVQRRIEVQFDAAVPQKIALTATYMVRHAGWSALYRGAVPADLSGVDLTLFARIVQKSGEDWHQARLSVSNVVPLAGGQVPDPHSWWLDMPRPAPRLMKRAMVAADAAAPMEEQMERMVMEETTASQATMATADRRRSELAFEYAFKMAVDVPSGDGETVLPVFTRRLEGEVYRLAVPRQSPLTYLVCDAKADRELLSGPLNVYFSGRYVGKMMLEEKTAGADFRIGLGADRQVVVTRERVTDRRKETFFGKIDRDSVVRELGYRIVAENLLDKPVALRVMDSVPVSRVDRIKVEDLSLAPTPDETDYRDRQGVMIWRLSLSPGEKKTIDTVFTVVYPKDAEPLGL